MWASGHGHDERDGGPGDERPVAGLERSVVGAEAEPIGEAGAGHGEVAAGEEVRDWGDILDGWLVRDAQRGADIACVHDDLSEPCRGVSGRGGRGVHDVPEPFEGVDGGCAAVAQEPSLVVSAVIEPDGEHAW